MNPVLKLLLEVGRLTTAQMAKVAGLTEAEAEQHLEQLKQDEIFLGWRPVLDLSRETVVDAGDSVEAIIEVRITPEREGGLSRLADRNSRFDEVHTCNLVSGLYDLLVVVRGKSLQSVAAFFSGKLSPLTGFLSTAIHFLLRRYKALGFFLEVEDDTSIRLNVAA